MGALNVWSGWVRVILGLGCRKRIEDSRSPRVGSLSACAPRPVALSQPSRFRSWVARVQMPSVSLLSLDDDTLSYLLSTLEAPDLARSCCTSRALKQLVDREWADENKEKHSLWERHCQAIRLRRLKRHRSWKRAWLESRCHNCTGHQRGGWRSAFRQHSLYHGGVKLADGAKVCTGRRLVVPVRFPSGGHDGVLPGALTHDTQYT